MAWCLRMSMDFMLDRASLSIDSQNFMVKRGQNQLSTVFLGNVFAIHCQSCKYRKIQDHPVELIGQKPIGKICGKTNSRGSTCRRQLGNKTHQIYLQIEIQSTQFSTGNTIYPSHSFPTLGLNPKLQISLLYLDHPFRFSQRIHYRPYQRIW